MSMKERVIERYFLDKHYPSLHPDKLSDTFGWSRMYIAKFSCNMWAKFNAKTPRKNSTRWWSCNVKTSKEGFYMVQATVKVKSIKVGVCNVRPYAT